jgi:general stress protein 26
MKNFGKTVEVLLNNAKVAIVSSIDEAGFPNTKAMLPPRKRDGIKQLYFTTNTSSLRVSQFLANSKACVYFYDNQQFKGVMLKGTMEVLHDSKSKEMIWRVGDEMYYPAGVTDPDYSVLKFTAQNARFYSNFKSENAEL